MTALEILRQRPALHWARSKTGGNLFLRHGRLTLGTVFKREDGGFGWKARGVSIDDRNYQTEEQAIEELYSACGL